VATTVTGIATARSAMFGGVIACAFVARGILVVRVILVIRRADAGVRAAATGAIEQIVAASAFEPVSAGATTQRVVAFVAPETIGTALPPERVIARAAMELVCAAPAE